MFLINSKQNKTVPFQAELLNSRSERDNIARQSGVFFAEVGIYGGGFGKVLTGVMFRFFAEIVARNRAMITHHSGPNFTPCSLRLVGIVLIVHLFLCLFADKACLILIIFSTGAYSVLYRRNCPLRRIEASPLHYTLFPDRK